MKRLGLLATGFGLAVVLAACSAGSDGADGSDDSGASSDAVSVAVVAPEVLDAVKAETGRGGVSARPIFEPDSAGPAFYEIALGPSDLGGNAVGGANADRGGPNAGWAVVSVPHDGMPAHVVEWSLEGRSPTERLDLGARQAMKRVYRLDAAVYIATDPLGNAVGRSTQNLVKIDRTGDTPTFVEVSNDEALRTWRSEKEKLVNAQLSNAGKNMLRTQDTPLIGAPMPSITCNVPGDVPSYNQLKAGEGVNTSACYSGCGPTAWATVFGWASRSGDAAYAGLLPNAPMALNDDVDKVLMDINHAVHTMCIAGEGATTPWSMAEVQGYISSRAPGVKVDQRYNFLMTSDPGVRDVTIDALCDGRPAIIGIGSLFGGDGHYPIAKGYSNGKFALEMGWGGDGNGWYDANTWYMGTIKKP